MKVPSKSAFIIWYDNDWPLFIFGGRELNSLVSAGGPEEATIAAENWFRELLRKEGITCTEYFEKCRGAAEVKHMYVPSEGCSITWIRW